MLFHVLFSLALFIFALGLVAAQTSQIRINQLHRRLVDQSHRSNLDQAPPEEYYFDQLVDHFSTLDNRTFKNRYYLSTQFYKQGGPVYLYNAGEGTLQPWALEGHLAELAKLTKGAIVAMEHRYYGKSIPVPDFSTENMRFLSVRQALADMAYFIQKTNFIQGIGDLPIGVKWIDVGGSYPGNLAAWMRETYPSLVYAAYSSSAPVKAKRNFYEYDQAVGAALNPVCSEAMQLAIQYIDEVLTRNDTEQIKTLKSWFGLDIVRDNVDFASALSDAPSYLVQYGNVNSTSRLCGNLTNNGTIDMNMFSSNEANKTELAIGIVQRFGKYQQIYMKENEIDASSYNGGNNSIKIEDNKGGSRQWFYQTCTEFGYWQTAPPAPMKRWRSKFITVAYYENGCRDTFGTLDMPRIPNVDYINTVYKGQSIHTSRIVYVNGEIDPWRRLSVSAEPDSPAPPRNPNSPTEPMFVVKGGSHCTDLGGYRPTNSASLNETRIKVDEAIVRWLSDTVARRH